MAGTRPAHQDIGVLPEAISDEPLQIRPLANTDIEPIFQACQDPEIPRWTVAIPSPYTHGDAEWFVTEYCPASWADGSECTWGIADPATAELLGVIGLRNLGDGCGEVGYWLATGGRGRGAATQAVALVSRFGFERLGYQAVRWQAIEGNEASRRVAERVGFRVSGPVRRLLNQRGLWRDAWIGTLLPTDEPPPAPIELTDGVVTLRAPRADDLAVLPDLVDDQVLAWTGVPGRTQEELGPWLDFIRRPNRPPAARFAIADGSGELLGFVRLSQEPYVDSTTIGWWIGPQARGKGLAYRAVRLAVDWAVSQGARRLAAGIFDGNASSIALSERIGMRSEGLRRAYWPARTPGDPYRDTWLYSLVPGDSGWPDSAV
ncbi:MAG TPA: GNAT family N-acetyltransferase [Frankiaceae bacterium]|nr:GNAT family N-acetyltransferase [Frankiaceae bacterium]